ncbi:MAG: hypothetical protein HY791_11330 [Deltaproteobacteria bacterium]|nr:hypothetical protein [Deltaproteobacteria bacterium]
MVRWIIVAFTLLAACQREKETVLPEAIPPPTFPAAASKEPPPQPTPPPNPDEEFVDLTECPDAPVTEGEVTMNPSCWCNQIDLKDVNEELRDISMAVRQKECRKEKKIKGRPYCECVLRTDWTEPFDSQAQCDTTEAKARAIVSAKSSGKGSVELYRPCTVRQ